MANNWMNKAMSPSKKAIMGYLASQQKGAKNQISTLHDQYVGMGEGPVVKGLNNMISGLPTTESINNAYGQASTGLGNLLSGYNTAQGGKDVSSLTQAMGAGIGVPEGIANDLATQAGTLSGVGSWGGNVADKALLLGTGAKFATDATADVRSAADIRMQLLNNLFTAQGQQQDKKSALKSEIAGLKDKQNAAKMSPFDLATMLMKVGINRKSYEKSMGVTLPTMRSGKTPLNPVNDTTTSTTAWGQSH
jgi:hypothetical protein